MSHRAHAESQSIAFVRDIERSDAVPAGILAEQAALAVMGGLIAQLTVGTARGLVDALPESIAPMFDAYLFRLENEPSARCCRRDFVAHVAEELGVSPAQAQVIARAVFGSIAKRLTRPRVEAVAAQLPSGLRELWCDDSQRSLER
jgi:hypothetical protein